jgi:hypothetical protein
MLAVFNQTDFGAEDVRHVTGVLSSHGEPSYISKR